MTTATAPTQIPMAVQVRQVPQWFRMRLVGIMAAALAAKQKNAPNVKVQQGKPNPVRVARP